MLLENDQYLPIIFNNVVLQKSSILSQELLK